MRARLLSWLGGACALLATAVPVAAQTVVEGPSPAERCLTPPPEARGLPDYPADLVARKDGGTLDIELIFVAPDMAPRVRVLDSNVDRRLDQAVRDHVQQLRVPCMVPGTPVSLRQQYVFVPDGTGKRVVSRPMTSADQAQDQARRCLTRIDQEKRPDYPMSALQQDRQGNFLVQLRFEAPDQPPQVRFLAGVEHRRLRTAIENFVRGYRLPCVGAGPQELAMVFKFQIQDSERVVLRDMPLVQLLRNARQPLPPAYFEFDRMGGCPFELRLRHFQPFLPNEVSELDTSHPARWAFVDWLRGLTLNLTNDQHLAVLGDSLTVTVPCGTLNL